MELFVKAVMWLGVIILVFILVVFGGNVLRAALPATVDASAKLGTTVGDGIKDIVNPGYVAPQPAPTAAPAPAPVVVNPPVVPIFPGSRVVVQPASAPQQVVDCDASGPERRNPTTGQTWSPSGNGPRIINFWTNEPGRNQGERKLLLGQGEFPQLRGGGSSWAYPAGCQNVAQDDYAGNSLPSTTLAQLQAEGLAQ